MFHPYDNCFSGTEKKVERFLISINQSQMSAVFYLQSSPKEIRWCSRFEHYWFNFAVNFCRWFVPPSASRCGTSGSRAQPPSSRIF